MNNYFLDKLTRQRDEIENLMKTYQQPTNIFNVGGSQTDFEARYLGKDEKPIDIMVQRKTAFISLENALLTIKEVNGDIKEYKIILPKTPEQIENEKLKEKIKELEIKLKEKESKNELKLNTTNIKEWKPTTNDYEYDEPATKNSSAEIS